MLFLCIIGILCWVTLIYLIVKCSQGKKVLTMRVSVVVDLTLYTFMYRGLPGKGLTAVFFLYVHTSGADLEMMGEEGAQNGDCYHVYLTFTSRQDFRIGSCYNSCTN